METFPGTKLRQPERIYIGGLNPPRLTAKDVLDRFQSIMMAARSSNNPVVEIQSVESISDKPYCHVVALSTSEEESSALKILASTFNNVKWKGCRLVVQAARPHFLELLELERQQRQPTKATEEVASKRFTNQAGAEIPGDNDKTESAQSSKLPRKLRIRKKFGEAAYHVDQKPWSVQDWSAFTHACRKLRRQVEKYGQEKKDAAKRAKKDASQHTTIMPPPFTHRAVHIRFDDDPKQQRIPPPGQNQNNPNADEDFSPVLEGTREDSSTTSISSSSEESSQSASQSESDHGMDDDIKRVPSSGNPPYAWSDDDGSDHDEPSKHSDSEFSDESEPELLPDASSSNDGESDEENKDSDQGSDQGISFEERSKFSVQGVHTTKSAVHHFPPVNNATYHWSSDEGSNDVDDYKYKSRPLVPVTQSDEFAAGLDLNEQRGHDSRQDESEDEVNPSAQSYSKDHDLSIDVTENLGILSSLFPEVADTLPAAVKACGPNGSEKENDSSKQMIQTGFGASGIMLRYDPNDASTQRFEIRETKKQEDSRISATEKDLSSSSEDERLMGGETNKKDEQTKDDDKKNFSQEQPVMVYQQKKLEEVFREARDAWTGKPSTEKSLRPAGGKSAGGAFSFAFDLGNSDSPNEEEAHSHFAFNFNFDRAETSEAAASDTSKEMGGHGHDAEQTSAEKVPFTVKVPEKRIRGFLFPTNAIEKYKSMFFSANNGDGIRKDIEVFRHDPVVKENWNKERQALTLDWKRKRKHAQSRIQKRMKIR